MAAKLVFGFGQFHTARPGAENTKPYIEGTLSQIAAMAKHPPTVDKASAKWVILSTHTGQLARSHAEQREHGRYVALWADVDHVEGLTWAEIKKRVNQAMPGFKLLIYSSRSATKDNPKCRIIIPLSQLLPGVDYSMMAKILNDRLQSAGLPPDRASERPGQI